MQYETSATNATDERDTRSSVGCQRSPRDVRPDRPGRRGPLSATKRPRSDDLKPPPAGQAVGAETRRQMTRGPRSVAAVHGSGHILSREPIIEPLPVWGTRDSPGAHRRLARTLALVPRSNSTLLVTSRSRVHGRDCRNVVREQQRSSADEARPELVLVVRSISLPEVVDDFCFGSLRRLRAAPSWRFEQADSGLGHECPIAPGAEVRCWWLEGRRCGCELRSAGTSAPARAFAERLQAPDARSWRLAGTGRSASRDPIGVRAGIGPRFRDYLCLGAVAPSTCFGDGAAAPLVM